MDTLARAPGGQMRGAATKAMSDIVEERQRSRYAPFAAAPLRAAAPRPAAKCEFISARALRGEHEVRFALVYSSRSSFRSVGGPSAGPGGVRRHSSDRDRS